MNDQTPFDQATRDTLDARADALDGATLSRLRQARAIAIDQGSRRRRWLTGWLPAAGALAAVALVAVNVWHGQSAGQSPDLALLESLASDSVQRSTIQPDPEFIEWLAQPHSAART